MAGSNGSLITQLFRDLESFVLTVTHFVPFKGAEIKLSLVCWAVSARAIELER